MVINFLAFFRLARLDKPRGILLLMWPTWAALIIAYRGAVPLDMALVFTFGVVLMRSVGCCINDYADREIDGRVRRTQARPLATREITVRQAWVFMAFLMIPSFGLWLYLGFWAKLMSLLALGIGVVYPFTKRFFFVRSWYLRWLSPCQFMLF